ncbi:MAG TPA: DUF4240 domain-containing protein [Phycisphaerae bacterium]|nr:DUF4240 domain-containing protein [Phycisphaerales bacterium]HRX85741.1 DUF4240 domain-containing protein [Phycisphaerae bacterium]
MTDDRFWRLIDEARARGSVAEHLPRLLLELNADEVVAFASMLSGKIANAGSFPLLAANFVIASYVSDEGFRSFRAWLVSQGRARYENAIRDPQTIADWLDIDEVDDTAEDPVGEAVCIAYMRHGDPDELHARTAHAADPDRPLDWPENKLEYRRRFPQLVDKFWNQQRINELHSD